ncbi:MAG: hypothetical protein ACRD0W_05660 [Acidimicrobiales bacterium]
MANVNCPVYLQGFSVRVTRLDECGEPDVGPCGFAVSDGYISATLAPNVEDGDEFKQKNAHGIFLANQRSRPLLNWVDVTIVFSKVDAELFSIVTGLPLVLNDAAPTPQAVGWGLTEQHFATANFATELWMGNTEQECGEDEFPWYGYNLLPWVVEGAVTEVSPIENALISFTVAGRSRKGTPWGVGPYDVVRLAATDAPSPLLASVPTDAHWWGPIQTQLAPPDEVCGCQELTSS